MPLIVRKLGGERLLYAALAFALGAAFGLWPRTTDFPLLWYVGQHPAGAYDFNLVHTPGYVRFDPSFAPNNVLPYGYPPTLLLLLHPVSFVPVAAARVLWCAGWCAAFVYAASKETGRATALLFLSTPLLWCLTFAQTGIMIATLVILGFRLLDERPRMAGVLLGIAACIKPQAMLLAPIVLWGRWPVVRAAMVAGIVAVLASLAFGPDLWLQWVLSLPRFAAYVEPKMFHVSPAYAFEGIAWRVGIAMTGLWFAWRERNLMGLLTGNLLCTPYVQFYDLVGFSYLGARLVAKGRRASAVEMVLGVALTLCLAWPRLMAIYCAVLIGISVFTHWRAKRGQPAPVPIMVN